MDAIQKLDGVNKMIRELEDVKNSQASVLKKVAQIEAENLNLNIKDLNLDDVYEIVDNTLEKFNQLAEKLETYRDDFMDEHNLNTEIA